MSDGKSVVALYRYHFVRLRAVGIRAAPQKLRAAGVGRKVPESEAAALNLLVLLSTWLLTVVVVRDE
jgi:hypothetical protein